MKPPFRNCRPLLFCLGMGLLTGSDNNFADAGSTFAQTPSSVTPASSPREASRARCIRTVLQLELQVKF
jgi:hypothetical protein